MAEYRYCRTCNKQTLHDEWTNSAGFERVFFGIFTLGMAEMMRHTWLECQHCGRTIQTS